MKNSIPIYFLYAEVHYKLFGVFPIEAADISYTISAADGNVVTFNATFAYQFFKRDNEINQVLNKIGKLL